MIDTKRDFERYSAVAGFAMGGPATFSSAVVFAFEALVPPCGKSGGMGWPAIHSGISTVMQVYESCRESQWGGRRKLNPGLEDHSLALYH